MEDEHMYPCPCVCCPGNSRIQDVAVLFQASFAPDSATKVWRRYNRPVELNLMLSHLEKRASDNCPDAMLYLAEYHHVELVRRLLNRVRQIEGPERADHLWNLWD
jgi:hypothetical protein